MVLAASGYPGDVRAGQRIEGLEQVRDEYPSEEKVVNWRLPVEWPRHEFEAKKAVKNVEATKTILSPYRRVSIMDLLSGQLTKEQKAAFKGSIVIIGSTALGYWMLRAPNMATPRKRSIARASW